MPLTLCGIFLVLALWEGLRMLFNYFKLERESLFYQAFLLVGKIGMLNDHEIFYVCHFGLLIFRKKSTYSWAFSSLLQLESHIFAFVLEVHRL